MTLLVGDVLSQRVLAAENTFLLVLDSTNGIAYLDRDLAELLDIVHPLRPGTKFSADCLLPSTRVAQAIAMGQAGVRPESVHVAPRGQANDEQVLQCEVFPLVSARLSGGSGVLCLLSQSQTPSATTKPVDSVKYAAALDERLARERIETTQAVAVTMRHEINNALTSLLGNAELLLRRTDRLDDLTVERIHEIVHQGRRIQTVLDRLEALTEIRTTTYYGGVQMIDLEQESDNDKP